MPRQDGPQPARVEHGQARAEPVALAQLEHVMGVGEAVAVHPVAGRDAVGVDAAEVHRPEVGEAQAKHARLGQRRDVGIALDDRRPGVGGGVEQSVGAFGQHGPPALEVALGGGAARHPEAVDVVVHDGGTRAEAGEGVGRDLVGLHGHVRVLRLGGHPVDGGLDDHRFAHPPILAGVMRNMAPTVPW